MTENESIRERGEESKTEIGQGEPEYSESGAVDYAVHQECEDAASALRMLEKKEASVSSVEPPPIGFTLPPENGDPQPEGCFGAPQADFDQSKEPLLPPSSSAREGPVGPSTRTEHSDGFTGIFDARRKKLMDELKDKREQLLNRFIRALFLLDVPLDEKAEIITSPGENVAKLEVISKTEENVAKLEHLNKSRENVEKLEDQNNSGENVEKLVTTCSKRKSKNRKSKNRNKMRKWKGCNIYKSKRQYCNKSMRK